MSPDSGYNRELLKTLPFALEVIAVVLMLVLGAWQLRVVVLGDSANSRLATAFALVHYGTWYIDDPTGEQPNPFGDSTVDKGEVGGRIQSTKPPLLPLMMTAEYAFLNAVAGLQLDERDDARLIVRIMVVTLMLLPLALGMLAFAACLRLLDVAPWPRAYLMAVLALGTPALGFAGHINNHTPAMALLCIASWCTLGALASGKPMASRLFLFGLTGGLVFALDLPVVIYIAFMGLALLWKYPREALIWGALGVALPVGIQVIALYQSTGSILPIQMHPDWYLYQNAYWRNPGGMDALNEPKGTYLFHMTLGRYGTFLLFPALATGLFGGLLALTKPRSAQSWLVLGGGAAFCILTAYYVLKTNNYGGAAYGFRWHLGSAPVLLLMSVPLWQRLRHPAWAVPAMLLFGISAYSAWECWRDPWSKDLEWTVRLIFGPLA